MIKGNIFNIQRFCIHDGPGIRTTVFLKGCPLHCSWCHNPESQSCAKQLCYISSLCINCGQCSDNCPLGIHAVLGGLHSINLSACTVCAKCCQSCPTQALTISGQELSADEVINTVMLDFPYYASSGGGLTLSGGEPFLQPLFTAALLAAAKQNNLHTCIETCGFCEKQHIELALDMIDLFLFDYKLTDDCLHKKYTGVSNSVIIENLEYLNRRGCRIILRCPIIPGINDTAGHFKAIADLSYMESVQAVELMPYHALGADKAKQFGLPYSLNIKSASQELICAWKSQLDYYHCRNVLST